MNTKMITAVAIVALLASTLAIVDVDADGTGTGFTVTDGDGRTYEYDGPSEHIVSTGYAVSHTLQQLGALDKVVATDYYGSKEYALASFGDDSLQSMDALNLGSIFSSDIIDSFETELPRLVEAGELNKDDTIILTTSSKIYEIRDILNGHGFTHVLLYKDVEDYDTIVNMMRTLSLVATGEVDERVDRMVEVQESISSATSGLEPVEAIYVWHNSNGLAVGNTGIMSSMLEICNADQIGLDPSVDRGYYGDETMIVQLIGEHPDAVIFINYSYFTAGNTLDDFRDRYLGGDTSKTIVQMGNLWNNYCFESADALTTIAQYLYPDVFGSTEPTEDQGDDGGSDLTLYIALGVVVIVVVVAIGYYLMRRP